MRNGFFVSRPKQGLAPCGLPMVEGALREAGCFGMLRLYLWSRVAAGLQHIEEASMQDEALGLEKALIGGIANESVLEEVSRFGRCAAPKNQLGFDELPHGFGQLVL